MKVRFENETIYINGQPDILYGGEFQYFRIPHTTWSSSLQALKDAGLNCISFYIPWIWHEIEEGIFDFSGETLPERNLLRFFELCEALELSLIVRPGPYVYGEYQGFGVPDWLRRTHPEILMKYNSKVSGNEIALNHPLFLSFVKAWFVALLVILRPLIKSGRVLAWQIDNETGLPQFGGLPTCGEFNPDTISRYQSYLQKHYKDIQNLNKLWNAQFQSFQDIQPPLKSTSSFSKISLRQWAEFIEDYIAEYLSSLKEMLNDLQVDCFTYFNDPYLCQWPNHSPKKAKINPIGFDVYTKVTNDTTAIHDFPYAFSYAPEFFKSINKGTIQIGTEIGTGWFDPRVTVSPVATEQLAMVTLLRGVKMLKYYLLQDCIETDGIPWIFQSPIDKDGQLTERYEVIKKVGHFLKQFGNTLAQSETLYSSIAVLKYMPQGWDLLRANYTVWTALDSMDHALNFFNGITGLVGGLIEAGFNPVVHDLESISIEELMNFKVVFFPSLDSLDWLSYDKLYRYVEQGGNLISFGFPVKTNLAGQPYQDNPLFPAREYGNNNKMQFGTNSVLSQVAGDIMDYQLLRRSIHHKLSLATLDQLHPFTEMMKYIGKTGTWLKTDRNEPFWASRFINLWQGGGITPILNHSNGIVGYSKRVGQGKIRFLGTIPGLFFDTPAYYTIESEKKESIIKFWTTTLKEAGVKPLIESIPGVEVIIKELESGILLGLINRQSQNSFTLAFNRHIVYSSIDIIYTSHGNNVLKQNSFFSIEGFLEEQGILVCLLT